MHGTSVIPQETVLFVVKPNYKYNFPKLSGGKLIPNAATVFHEHILLLYGLLITVLGIYYIILFLLLTSSNIVCCSTDKLKL